MRVSRQFYFLNGKILHPQKAQKSTKKHKKHKKHKTQTGDFHSDVFYAHKKHKNYKKHIKAQNVKQTIFFLLDVFIVHKNAVFFVSIRLDNFKLLCFLRENFTHKKTQKA